MSNVKASFKTSLYQYNLVSKERNSCNLMRRKQFHSIIFMLQSLELEWESWELLSRPSEKGICNIFFFCIKMNGNVVLLQQLKIMHPFTNYTVSMVIWIWISPNINVYET